MIALLQQVGLVEVKRARHISIPITSRPNLRYGGGRRV
jgi:hypothetical protein